jgi:hypothetical protein
MTQNATSGATSLTPAQLADMMRLLKGADTAELKLTIPPTAQRATIVGLGLDPVEAQPRQVFFFDTPDLALDKAGMVVRARRIQGGRADTVVKLRPIVPDELDAELRKSGALTVEVDAIPGGFVCSASFKGRTTGEDVRAAVAGEMPLRKVFSKEQRAFYAEHAPAGVQIDDLIALGPTFILKGAFIPKDIDRRVVAEMWLYPDGSRLLELSTKCLPDEAFQVAAEFRAYLHDRGIEVGGTQQTKTHAALEYFAAEAQRALPARTATASGAKRTPTTKRAPSTAKRATSTTRRAAGGTGPKPASRSRPATGR